MNTTGIWRIVSSPDFDDAYLRMEVEPYIELMQTGSRVSGTYHVGLQQDDIDGRIEGGDRVAFSFEGMDEQFARSLAENERALRGPDFTLDQLIAQEELFQQAVQVMVQQRWAEAEPLFRQSIAMGDVLPQPWGKLGLCLLMQRQFDAAETTLRRALAIDSEYTIARQNLAGLPTIRATGKLPAMHINKAFDGKSAKVGLTFVTEGNKR